MKLVAALGHVEAVDSLPRFAERRLTPTTVRASCFERSGDSRRAYANRSAGASTEMRGDGAFSCSDFAYDPDGNAYVCSGGKKAEEIQPRVLQAAPRADEGRHAPLLCEEARLRRLARLSQNAARTCQRARSRAPFMKPLATRRAQSSRPRPTSSHVGSERRSRCSLPISGAPARTERSERRVPSGRRPQSEEAGEVDPLRSIFATERRHPRGVVAPTRAPTALSSLASSGASGCKGLKVSFV
jgi:hypothetical protein